MIAAKASALMLIATLGAQPATNSPTPAFPGAEGAGASSVGGRGGRVVRVTTLADSGPGSLRAALEAEGPRTVIFDIGGLIRLTSPITVRHGRLTLAGQTAPGGGVTLADQPLILAADDVVVRFIRSRLGDLSGVEADAISVVNGHRVILDHVSASWSVDETLSVGSPDGDVRDVTVQWSLIAESLNASGHAKGEHGYGSLLRARAGARIDLHHNLWASHSARMPRPGNYAPAREDPQGPRFGLWNNVFYNWGGGRSGYNSDTDSVTTYAFVANAYRPGPNSERPRAFAEGAPLARAWFEANSMAGRVPGDPWSLTSGTDRPGYRLEGRPDWLGAVSQSAAEAEAAVLKDVGAARVRDAVDRRILAGVVDGTGRIIDSQAEVGGWPALDPGKPWVDTDRDGLPDDWEQARRLNPRHPADGSADPDGDGFTNLEDWLNAVAAERL